MAKKTNSFSHPKATEKLDQLAQSGTSATELIYDLLRIFANFDDGQVRRTKEGPGNAIHDDKTALVKKLNVEKIKPSSDSTHLDMEVFSIPKKYADLVMTNMTTPTNHTMMKKRNRNIHYI
jgi:hypothetical protein